MGTLETELLLVAHAALDYISFTKLLILSMVEKPLTYSWLDVLTCMCKCIWLMTEYIADFPFDRWLCFIRELTEHSENVDQILMFLLPEINTLKKSALYFSLREAAKIGIVSS